MALYLMWKIMATKDINDSVKPIQDAWESIKNDFFKAAPGKYLELTCVYRSPEEQLELFKYGRILGTDGKWYVQDKAAIITNADGLNYLSPHNYRPSRAIDVGVKENSTGNWLWADKHFYPLAEIVKKYGLESGGNWKTFQDWAHIQVPNYKTYKDA